MPTSYHARMIRVTHTHDWVMSRMNESCRIWLEKHDEYVISRMNESCHAYAWMSRVTHEWVMPHLSGGAPWIRYVTHEWFMSRICMNETCRRVMSHMVGDAPWIHQTTHEWVMPSIHINETCHTWMKRVTHEWVVSHMSGDAPSKAVNSGVNVSIPTGPWFRDRIACQRYFCFRLDSLVRFMSAFEIRWVNVSIPTGPWCRDRIACQTNFCFRFACRIHVCFWDQMSECEYPYWALFKR